MSKIETTFLKSTSFTKSVPLQLRMIWRERGTLRRILHTFVSKTVSKFLYLAWFIFCTQLTLSPRSAHLRALLNVVYILAPKRHIRALFSSQSPSNKTINNVLQNGGDLKWICDISSQFFRVFLAELTICLQGDLNMANVYTDIGEFCRICLKTPEDIYR